MVLLSGGQAGQPVDDELLQHRADAVSLQGKPQAAGAALYSMRVGGEGGGWESGEGRQLGGGGKGGKETGERGGGWKCTGQECRNPERYKVGGGRLTPIVPL